MGEDVTKRVNWGRREVGGFWAAASENAWRRSASLLIAVHCGRERVKKSRSFESGSVSESGMAVEACRS